MKNENDFQDLTQLASYLKAEPYNRVKFDTGYLCYDGLYFHVYQLDLKYIGKTLDINEALDTLMLQLSA